MAEIDWNHKFERFNVQIPNDAVLVCENCNGMMVKKWAGGIATASIPSWTGWIWKCLNCGNKINGGTKTDRGDYFIVVFVPKAEEAHENQP